jgi:uncharacterized protein YjbI with pentapeptide repeats
VVEVAEVPARTNGVSPVAGAETSDIEAVVACSELADRTEAQRRVRCLTEHALAKTGRGLDLTQGELSGRDLSGFDLRYAILNRASLYGAVLVGADLSGCSLVCAGMERTDLSGAVLRGAYVHALAAQASTFVGADLSGLVDATGALFHGCDLSGAVLDDAELAGTTFYQCGLSGAKARSADLCGVVFNECRMGGADLAQTRLDDAMILRSDVREVVLEGAMGGSFVLSRPTAAGALSMAGAHLPGLRLLHVRARGLAAAGLQAPDLDVQSSYLADVDLSGSDLVRGRWRSVTLDRASLRRASLADSLWSEVTAVGLDASNATGEGMTASECCFEEAVFAGFAGRYATFRNCDLRGADLRGAYLYRSSIVGDPTASACMVDTQLDNANLTQAYLAADFTRAQIRRAWATYARVNQSTFAGADLSGTSLYRASAVKTDFTGARLAGQRGVLLADRCVELVTALRASGDPASSAVAQRVEELRELLARDTGKST